MGLNKQDALKIAKKLKAKIDKSGRRAHDLAQVFHEGKLITSFGIRRGKADLGHNHISASIYVTPRQSWELANCPMSQDEWVKKMKAKRVIPADELEGV